MKHLPMIFSLLAFLFLTSGSRIGAEQKSPELKPIKAPEVKEETPPAANRPAPRPARNHRNIDPEKMADSNLPRFQKLLSADDEQWGTIRPPLRRVVILQMKSSARGLRRPANNGMLGIDAEEGELRRVMAQPDVSDDEISERLAVLRDFRRKKELEMKEARDDLREVLNIRQQAFLVLRGVLD
jgi:hypothetical protein